MFTVKRLVWVMGCVCIMDGCAWYQSGNKPALSIKPVMDVKHAAGGSEAMSMYWLGRYHQGKANYTEAIAAYEKALAVDPAHVEAHNGLGVSCSLQGRHELALQHLRKAIELSPLATHLRNNLGYAHLAQGQESEAAAAFEQALRLDPENRQARSNLAAVYEKAGLHDKAPAMLTMARHGSATAPVATSVVASGPAHGSPSATMPDTVTAVTAGKREKRYSTHSTHTRLVQVAPEVFELRVTEADPIIAIRTGKATGKTVAAQNSGNLDSKNVRIEVSNGNGVTGMAGRVSGFLEQSGFARARLTDRQPYRQARTEIHYRSGHSVPAGRISRMMPNQAPMIESDNLRADIQIRVLLGKDIARKTAYFANRSKIQIARRTGRATAREQAGEQIPGKE